jgi:hypothetical protein
VLVGGRYSGFFDPPIDTGPRGGSSFRMSRKPLRRARPFRLLAVLAVLALGACALPTSGHTPVIVTAESLTIAWDPPRVLFPAAPLAISFYKVYFSRHGAADWSCIGLVPASGNPTFTLDHSRLGDGTFDFAVRAVDGRGEESTLHSSLDASADPFGGWFIIWTRSR